MPKNLQMFIPLTKIDVEQRLVYGIATCEKLDRTKQVCDYETTKPLYQKWSEEVSKASGGKSLGNVRVMHGKVAAGKLAALNFNDDEKQIEICAKVVDDNEWNKVQEGVYTGFSQGGSYAKVWKDADGNERYTADPIEVSLVDIPCLPDATFTMMQMAKNQKTGEDEVIEVKKSFAHVCEEPSVTEIGNRAEAMAKAASTDTLKKNWQDFTDEARLELLQEQVDNAFAKAMKDDEESGEDEDEEDQDEADGEKEEAKEEKPEPKKKKKKKDAEKWVEPIQVWKCNCPDHQHLTKVEAVKCLKVEGAKESAHELVAPLTGALAKLNAALGNKPTTSVVATSNDDSHDLTKFIKSWKVGDDIPAERVDELLKLVDGDSDLAKAINGDTATHTTAADVMKSLQKHLGTQTLEKGLYAVSRFACLLDELRWLQNDAAFEASYEEDGSDVPDQIKAGIKMLCEALQAMVAEECEELFPEDAEEVDVVKLASSLNGREIDALVKAGGTSMKKHGDTLKKAIIVDTDLEKIAAQFETTRDSLPETAKDVRDQLDKCAAFTRGLGKAGARHSKKDVEMVQMVHDLAMGLGALCETGNVEKTEAGSDLAKLENAELRKQLDAITPQIETLTEQVQKLLAEPRAPKAKAVVVGKGASVGDDDDAATVMAKRLEAMSPDERNKELMKLALKTGTNGHPAHSDR